LSFHSEPALLNMPGNTMVAGLHVSLSLNGKHKL
jgi:hypothetical protein